MKRTPLGRSKGLSRKTPLRSGDGFRSTLPGASSRPVALRKPVLRRIGPPKPRRPQKALDDPGRKEWTKRRTGCCASCGRRGRVVLHHAFAESLIRRYGGDSDDLRWGIPLGAPYVMGGNPECVCHASHHVYGVRDTRLPVSIIPGVALTLARETFGEARTEDYLRRHYKPINEGEN